jgi:hypothetical protein
MAERRAPEGLQALLSTHRLAHQRPLQLHLAAVATIMPVQPLFPVPV